MPNRALARQRLHAHRLAATPFATPAEAVAWLGAMQGQEHLSVRWAIGLRCAGHDEAAVQQALDTGQVVRTWAMRGTLQLAAAADVRWLVNLTGPPALARHGSAQRKLGVDAAAAAAAEPVFVRALRGQTLTRAEVFAALEQAGLSTAGQRGYYYLVQAALRGQLCLGPLRGKQETYVLLDEWAPNAKTLPREQAVAELARRYFASHGPATLEDYAWWSGLPKAEVRAGLEAARPALVEQVIGGVAYYGPPEAAPAARGTLLLPAFDEYILGYTDRTAVLAPEHSPRVLSNNGIFYPTILSDGAVIGTWKRTIKKDTVAIALSPFKALTRAQRAAVGAAAERYAAFVGLGLVVMEA